MNTEEAANMTDDLPWHKSNYSGSSGGNCVEVATCHNTTYVRDSKDARSPILSVPHTQWTAFIEQLAEER